MSVLKNSNNVVVPIRERREISGSLGALNAELVLDANGDQSANLYLVNNSLIGTLSFSGSVDGTNYFNLPAFPMGAASVGGTLLQPGQPIISHAVVAANTQLGYTVFCGQCKRIRVMVSAYTSGNCTALWISEMGLSVNMLATQQPATLFGTVTAASGVAATLTLPAVTGFRQLIKSVSVVRSAAAVLTASATPTLVTTSNLPGSPVLTFGSDAAAIGADKELKLDCGGNGLLATALGTATTIVCPVTTGVIWRVNAAYGLVL